MKIKPRGKIYSINEGYAKYWYDPVIDYVDSKKNPKVSSWWKKIFYIVLFSALWIIIYYNY